MIQRPPRLPAGEGRRGLRRRLQACMRDLGNPDLNARTITSIALTWGFNQSAHFSRVFREHTGLSPSDYRQLQRRNAKLAHLCGADSGVPSRVPRPRCSARQRAP
ncbi:MAG: hypothetical protein B7X56_02485 [Burkholderiales bacterium 34-67-9]|nr:MAG: hypothetical protein B7X56_02485 [Burkholderiales bacterium 34-67-9]